MSVIVKKEKNRQLHKFGGSSLVDAKCYLRVARIIAEHSAPNDIIVVSAAGSTTNQLISWLKQSQKDHFSAYHLKQSLYHYQSDLIIGLLWKKVANRLINSLTKELKIITKLLDNGITQATYAEIVSYGEIWSARLMATVLKQQGLKAVWLDARKFLRAEFAIQPKIDERLSYPLLQKILIQHPNKRIVVTGFISRNKFGETVLLGRNGSDYSATQIGALANVSEITLWSDVAGVHSADPHKVKDACLLPLLRFDEASELARLAIPILHMRTLQPISCKNINLKLRCSYTPNEGSTIINRVSALSAGARVIISHDDVCLIDFQISSNRNLNLIKKDIYCMLKRAQASPPLAMHIHKGRRLLQLCYTKEMIESVLQIFNEANLTSYFRLRHEMVLVAIVGADVTRNKPHCNCFRKQLQDQPVEFTWQSEKGISLVAVLRKSQIDNLIQRLHTALFYKNRMSWLNIFGEHIKLLKLVRII